MATEFITVNGHVIPVDPDKGPGGKRGLSRPSSGAPRYRRGRKTAGRIGFRSATDEERAALKIPPAWTDVQIASDPDSKIAAVGRDSKGRQQYRYSAAHNGKQKVAKFVRAKHFEAGLDALVKQFTADLTDPENQEEASALYLIHKTGFRVGGRRDTGAEKQAYGATTLTADHVSVNGSTVDFEFVGKKGVGIRKSVTDPDLARIISERKERGGNLFNTTDAKVRKYLHSIDGGFLVKDFRTHKGTSFAADAMSKMPAPTDQRSFDAARDQVGKLVAAQLGNTPKVALESYIDPHIFESWEASIAGLTAPK